MSRDRQNCDSSDIVLIGYYGKRNFGDDVLMMVAHAIARTLLPEARIGLLDSKEPYISRLLGRTVGFVPYGSRSSHQLLVHGGGGTFFDFAKHGPACRIFSQAALAFGPRAFVALETAARALVGRPRLSATHRVGLGLGIGTFSLGSPALLNALPALLDFDALWLRDPASATNLQSSGITVPTIIGSDLAFLHEHWCPPELALAPRAPRANGQPPLVGLILRDWPARAGGELAAKLRDGITELSRHYRLQLISLNPEADRETISAFSTLPHLLWTPDSIDLADFLRALAEHDVLVTARAHGAICGACLGLPAVVLGIEPKLEGVHSMLRDSSQFVAEPFCSSALHAAVERAFTVSHESIVADVERNRDASKHALSEVLAQVGQRIEGADASSRRKFNAAR